MRARVARRFGSALLACLCVSAVGAAPGFADFIYPFERELAPKGGSFGFVDAGSVAVNDFNGDTYVADSGAGAVDVFETSTGTQLASLVAPTPPGSFGGGAVSVAANNGTGKVYVLDQTDGVVDVYEPSGAYLCQITGSLTPSATECNGPTGSKTPAGGFSAPWGVAVDQATGELYVLDPANGVVDVFSVAGAYVTQIVLPGGTSTQYARGVEVDDLNGHVYVSDSGSDTVYEFDSAGKYLTTWNGGECQAGSGAGAPGSSVCATPQGSFGGGFVSVAADNASGRVYVTATFPEEQGGNVVDVFDASGRYLTQFSHSFRLPRGVAVDQATHAVYVSDSSPGAVDIFGAVLVPDVTTETVSEREAGSVTLRGKVNPDGMPLTDCHFDYGTTTAYGQVASCVPSFGSISGETAVSAHLTGLVSGTVYHYRLSAANANGTNVGGDLAFETLGPSIRAGEESVTEVSAKAATFHATIDPNGDPTSYYFQYATSPDFSGAMTVPAAPGQTIGSGSSDVQVTQQAQSGLSQGTLYYYRAVAVSEVSAGHPEPFYGETLTFTTQTAGPLELPDGRQWELVSPANKLGARPVPGYQAEHALQASAAGDAITYPASAPTEPQPQGLQGQMQVLSTRGAAGWQSRDLEIPRTQATGGGLGLGTEYQLFSSDLSLAALNPWGGFDPSLSAEANEQTAYLRSNFTPGNVSAACTQSCYRPLVTGKEGYANVPAGTHFSTDGECKDPSTPPFKCGPKAVGVSLDFKHVVLASSVALTSQAISERHALYEWSAGKLQVVSVLPEGEGGTVVYGNLGNNESLDGRSAGAVSSDGSRVIWSYKPSFVRLYMSDTASGRTVSVRLDEGLGGNAVYQGASSDASRVFFTDEGDLYEYRVGHGLEAITKGAHVPGSIVGLSEDGSRVFFVGKGAIAGVAGAVDGAPNLYEYHEGTTSLVAVLSPQDRPVWGEGTSEEAFFSSSVNARVSPDGRWLAFMSSRSLTGYDNRDAVSGQRDEEVYLYNSETGRLACVSCDPSGARPLGVEGTESMALGEEGSWQHVWVAANVPGWTLPGYQSRFLSNEGRMFFNSGDALVPQDVNGTEDVYEWEPPGVGGCSAGGVGFSARSGGCVGLISSGRGIQETAFIDASESGGDVFFMTSARLVPADFDAVFDVYDAHECTPGSPCFPEAVVSHPPCGTADACRAAPSPQPGVFGSPGTAVVSGASNLAPPPPSRAVKPKRKPKRCRNGMKLRHGRCMKRTGKHAKSNRRGK